MKNALNFMIFLLAGVFLFTPASFGEEGNPIKLPIASIPDNSFEFEKVVEGIQILHDFKVLNKGEATLNIDKVKTG
jgi:hypothetical protein